MSEPLWSLLKPEFFERRVWQTRAEAMREVAPWIEVAYDRRGELLPDRFAGH